jgi:hypothetical protein
MTDLKIGVEDHTGLPVPSVASPRGSERAVTARAGA